MDHYIPPDARILDADVDYKALAAQDPVWTPPPPQLRSLRANRREFIKGVIASGTAVSAVSYTIGARSARAQNAAGPQRLMGGNIKRQTPRGDVTANEKLARDPRVTLVLTRTQLGVRRGECGGGTVR